MAYEAAKTSEVAYMDECGGSDHDTIDSAASFCRFWIRQPDRPRNSRPGTSSLHYTVTCQRLSLKTAITVRLDGDLKRQLDEISQRSGCSRSDVVRDALRRHLSLLAFNRLREQIKPLAEVRGSLTDEDIFREIS